MDFDNDIEVSHVSASGNHTLSRWDVYYSFIMYINSLESCCNCKWYKTGGYLFLSLDSYLREALHKVKGTK